MSRSLFVATTTIVLSIGAQACAQPQAAPPSSSASASTAAAPPPPPSPPPALTSAAHAPSDRSHVYRLDFVLTSKEGAAAATTSFSLTLEEGRNGEVLVGKNVPISSAPLAATTGNAPVTAPTTSARQDVGLKVKAFYRSNAADELLFEIVTEMSANDPPSSIRKVHVIGNALAAAGKPTIVMSLDDDRKHYELGVTPTKIR